MLKRLFSYYGAGSAAAMFWVLAAWGLGHSGALAAAGTAWRLTVSRYELSSALVWGGLWALVYPILGLNRLSWLRGALLLSLFPSAADLLFFFPSRGEGWFGMNLGSATPFLIVALNLIWAVLATSFGNRAAK